MPEEVTAVVPNVVPVVVPPVVAAAPPTGDGEDNPEARGSKAAVLADLARERGLRQAAEARIADAEKAKLGETERAVVERDEARKDAESARAELARVKVGAKYGLSLDDLADLRADGTAEEFDARAKRLSERLKVGEKPTGLPRSPNAHREAKLPVVGVNAGRDMFTARKKPVTTP